MRLACALASLAIAIPMAAQQQTVTCSSNGSSQSCPADTRNGVLLVREQSSNACRQGQTWSYDRRGITVSGGCSADFVVVPRNNAYGSNGYGNSGYGGNGYGNQAVNNGVNGGPQYNGSGNTAAQAAIPQGTQVAFRMDQTVRLNELQQNDVVTGTLASDLVAGGQVIASSGTPVQAKVVSASGAPLDLRLDSIHVNNATYALQSNSVRSIRDAVSTGDSAAGRTGWGGVLNSFATAGTIPSGTVFNFRLTSTARAQ